MKKKAWTRSWALRDGRGFVRHPADKTVLLFQTRKAALAEARIRWRGNKTRGSSWNLEPVQVYIKED